MEDIFSSVGKSWFFWVILIVIIAFIVYSGLKKRKSDRMEKQKRENEVRELIKNHVKKTDNLTNVIVNYLDVKLRQGKLYKNRDVYDVFLAIKNPRTNKVITKKAYEIEGFAKPIPNSKSYNVNWTINREFVFEEHKKTFTESAPSSTSIYFKSLFKKNRKEFIRQQIKLKKRIEGKKRDLHEKLKKLEKEKNIFIPKPKKEEEN